jgi:hypothetical protein
MSLGGGRILWRRAHLLEEEAHSWREGASSKEGVHSLVGSIL